MGPPLGVAPPRYWQLADRAWLQARYRDAGTELIAREIGCRREAVRKALLRHSIELRLPGPTRNTAHDAQILRLHGKGLSMRAIATELGIGDHRVKRALDDLTEPAPLLPGKPTQR